MLQEDKIFQAGQEAYIYKDASRPAKERALDLLSRLTLREKVGQLNQRLYGFNAYLRRGRM